jgi:hypothetical protein
LQLSVLGILAGTAGPLLVQYLTYQVPEHAMTVRHLALAWPWLAFAPVIVLASIPHGGIRSGVLAILVAALMGLAVPWSGHGSEAPQRQGAFVFDNVRRGNVLSQVARLADDAWVVAADTDVLATNIDLWEEGVERFGSVLWVAHSSKPSNVRKLKAALSAQFRLSPSGDDAWLVEKKD